jgi:hypothetical protein
VYVEEVERMVRDAEEFGGHEPAEALALWMRISTKRVLIEALNRESPVLTTCRRILYDSGRPILERAQQAGVTRADVSIEDTMRLVHGLGFVTFPTPEDRDRVVGLAIDGLRAV